MENPIKARKQWQNYYQKNKKIIRKNNHNWYLKNRKRSLRLSKKLHLEQKKNVIFHYSKGKMCCGCCGETTFKFLTINHKKKDGAKHRKELNNGNGRTSGGVIYRYLIRNDFPKGYNILCYNCNCADGFFGKCPHKTKKSF